MLFFADLVQCVKRAAMYRFFGGFNDTKLRSLSF